MGEKYNQMDNSIGESIEDVEASGSAFLGTRLAHELDKLLANKAGKILLRKPLSMVAPAFALETLNDAYQGRNLASSAFNTPTPNLGQRASGVASSIANGLTFGWLGDPTKNARNMYKFYGGN